MTNENPPETPSGTHNRSTGGSGPDGNHLSGEKSPYLLQHAANPVDWFPWGPEAFAKAQQENKPIFLSIGYSTCHWCHVMAHESFEDPAVARLLNDVFVSIKVDREERPDIDSTYMTACQMINGSGGWPLTIFMTPDKRPFYAATYIPREGRFGRMGLLELIPRIKQLWITKQDELVDSAAKITAALQQSAGGTPGLELDEAVLNLAYDQLAQRFDVAYGGFGSAPKFPTPHNFLFLLRYWQRNGEAKALAMVEKSLQSMHQGGIFDHLGYGFHRYSTDRFWLLPHFEKMLYDQALLAMAYAETFQATGNPTYADVTREIMEYVLRDLTGPEGGFFSAEDADSEGEEGKFYLWTFSEIEQILGQPEACLFATVYNVKPEGNFTDQATGEHPDTNILHRTTSYSDLAAALHLDERELVRRLAESRKILFATREKRVHPGKDDKILTDWNGLMIASLAKASQALGEPAYAMAATKAADFILARLRRPDGRLLHRYRDGQADVEAFLDDYAFLIWGLLELYETNFETRYLQAALALNDQMLAHFWDPSSGGFYFTADDAENVLMRKKEIYDGAVPSGNSVAMANLLRLARMTGEWELEAKAKGLGQAFSGQVQQSPASFTQLMVSLSFALGPSYEVVVVGRPNGEDTAKLTEAMQRRFIPNKVSLFRPAGEASPPIDRLASFVRTHTTIDGQATAYVCVSGACHRPTTDPEEMLRRLEVR